MTYSPLTDLGGLIFWVAVAYWIVRKAQALRRKPRHDADLRAVEQEAFKDLRQ
jgi:hypothetical protein